MGYLGDIDVEFDFEEIVRGLLPAVSEIPASSFGLGSFNRVDPKLRTVVCRHWLQGLCQKGEKCDYLHKLDKARMPPCRHGKFCKIKNCPLKHVDEEERPECTFYKQGFCIHGPMCKYRHLKRPPDECPKEVNFEEYLLNTNGNLSTPLSKKRKTHQPNQYYKITLCKHWLEHSTCPYTEECHYAHGEQELRGFAGAEDLDDSQIIDATRNNMSCPLVLPFNSNSKTTYFLFHSPDLRSLAISQKRGVWATSPRIAVELTTAFKTSEHVIIFFVVRSCKGVYGMARLEGVVPIIPNQRQPSLTMEFPVAWMRTIRISLKLIAQLRMAGGLSLGKTMVDGKIDKNSGYEMLLIALRKPIWLWQNEIPITAASLAAARLPADTLFAADWSGGMDMVAMVAGGHTTTGGGGETGNSNTQRILTIGATGTGVGKDGRGGVTYSGGSNNQLPTSLQDFYYGGSAPGFVLPCVASLVSEYITRGCFFIPSELQNAAMKSIVPGSPIFLLISSTSAATPASNSSTNYAPPPPPPSIKLLGLYESISFVESDSSTGMGVVRIRVALEAPALSGIDIESEMPNHFPAPANLPAPGLLPLWDTKLVANVFARRAGAIPSLPPQAVKGISGSIPGGASTTVVAGGTAIGGLVVPHPTGVFRPRHKHTDTVPINVSPQIIGDGFHIRRRLLGSQAANVLQIVNAVSVPQSLQIRLRGLGSGFKEGPTQLELNEPLHFVVSAEEEGVLKKAVVKVKELVLRVQQSYEPQPPYV